MQKKHSWLILIIFPIIAIAIMHLLFGAILYDVIGWRSRIILALVEMVSLLFLLILLWFPTWLIIAEEKDYVEISSLYIRNAFLLFVTVIVIPYDLLNNYFKFEITLGNYLAFTIPITLIFFAIARMHAFKTPYRDVRELESGRPRKKKAKSRWLLFDVSALFLTLLVVICVHLWFFVSLDTGKSKLMPTLLIQYVEQRFL
ncbi:MAG: hypothetical protein ACE5I1_26750, partial [bacterium]